MKSSSRFPLILVACLVSFALFSGAGCDPAPVTLKPAKAAPGGAKARFESLRKMRDSGGPPTTPAAPPDGKPATVEASGATPPAAGTTGK